MREAAGFNLYRYVGNNPISYKDPLGLARWVGSGTAIAADYGGGAVRYDFELTSVQCLNGRKINVHVIAGGPTVGFGVLSGSISGGPIVFEDDNEYPDPFVFQGPAKFVSASLSLEIPWLGGIPGVGVAAIKLGDATSIGGGITRGFDVGISAGAGTSSITEISYIQCGCQ
jgi:hypothetical protein